MILKHWIITPRSWRIYTFVSGVTNTARQLLEDNLQRRVVISFSIIMCHVVIRADQSILVTLVMNCHSRTAPVHPAVRYYCSSLCQTGPRQDTTDNPLQTHVLQHKCICQHMHTDLQFITALKFFLNIGWINLLSTSEITILPCV